MNSITDDLRAAAEDVQGADLPQGLESAALVLAFWARRSGQSAANSLVPPHAPAGGAPVATDGAAAQIAGRLGLEPAEVEGVYDFSEEEVALLVSPRFLEESNHGGATQVAYLIAAARQACGEDWTHAAPIREVAKERGRLDGNFKVVLDKLDGNGASVKGEGHGRRVKLNAIGFEKAGEIARGLAAAAAAS
jgi:hypothetical protein